MKLFGTVGLFWWIARRYRIQMGQAYVSMPSRLIQLQYLEVSSIRPIMFNVIRDSQFRIVFSLCHGPTQKDLYLLRS